MNRVGQSSLLGQIDPRFACLRGGTGEATGSVAEAIVQNIDLGRDGIDPVRGFDRALGPYDYASHNPGSQYVMQAGRDRHMQRGIFCIHPFDGRRKHRDHGERLDLGLWREGGDPYHRARA